MDLPQFIASRGSLVATWELHTLGMRRQDIARAVAADVIVRVRQGWYCSPSLPPDAQRAARVGGQLACLSAARHHGLWVPDGDPRLHVAVEPDACQLREPGSYRRRLSDPTVEVHWTGRDETSSRAVVPPATALRQIAACQPPDVLHIVAESALHRGRVRRAQWEALESTLPLLVRRRLSPVTGLSGSGIESMFVARVRALGIEIRQQVKLPGVGYVDVVIGDRLIVELDGERFHRDAARDRHRDAVSSALGYRVLRFLANQVVHDWPIVEAAVIAALLRRDHRTA